MEQYYHFRHKT